MLISNSVTALIADIFCQRLLGVLGVGLLYYTVSSLIAFQGSLPDSRVPRVNKNKVPYLAQVSVDMCRLRWWLHMVGQVFSTMWSLFHTSLLFWTVPFMYLQKYTCMCFIENIEKYRAGTSPSVHNGCAAYKAKIN